MSTTTAQHHPDHARTGWRHALDHAHARLSDLRMRTTLGPSGPMDATGRGPILRDRPERVDH